ncbi:MAG TPA: hypothetical protein VER55_09270, partial [Ardenticatenaceae bacterium]|nr:hypothetical protein [Ardenticatenaceae bacterium]
MKQSWRHDLSYFVSVALIVVTLAATITGLVADFWDLNQFIYHVWAGYALIVFAILHVLLVGNRVIGYLRYRLRRRPAHQRAQATKSETATGRERAAEKAAAPVLRGSRRAVLQILAAAVGGLLVGRSRPAQSQQLYGNDIGVIYHEWSKPKISSMLGTLAHWG